MSVSQQLGLMSPVSCIDNWILSSFNELDFGQLVFGGFDQSQIVIL